jgi:hypothetical protein
MGRGCGGVCPRNKTCANWVGGKREAKDRLQSISVILSELTSIRTTKADFLAEQARLAERKCITLCGPQLMRLVKAEAAKIKAAVNQTK